MSLTDLAHNYFSNSPTPVTLSQFLRSHDVGTDRTLFVTMASESYIEPMVNFKRSLDKFDLGKDYVVLCFDLPCVAAAKKYDVLAYDGYIGHGSEERSYQIARAKVLTFL